MIAHALHHCEQSIDAGCRLVGHDVFDFSHDRFEPCSRGGKPLLAPTLGKFDDLCVHVRALVGVRLRPLR
ncbi:hypothetical protein SE92_26870 [Bradyrhizobium sp. AT1]|nr:hypothetical protein SE92_26870 [Bradyrhizobium sp. AT1]